ncbi:acid protease [Ascoidea rubescens DSM 1968]|uniref:Acid protease n=1 Tax=Ascoidea rubescens DSM 1968 TaxID=1344418 RepID=A0A1D2VS54_9ASCO|nr:acid protease [Ascoidea rubescens DSM 1968]ODV64431.1 acid protease [Ascoidea rubescens DSM 1968]
MKLNYSCLIAILGYLNTFVECADYNNFNSFNLKKGYVQFDVNKKAIIDPRIVETKNKKSNPFINYFKRSFIVADSNNQSQSIISSLIAYPYFYSIELKVGEPMQKIEVLLDTGSSSLWIQEKSNLYCLENEYNNNNNNNNKIPYSKKFKCYNKGFNETYSKTLTKYDKSDYLVSYVDQSFAKGKWVTENIKIGNNDNEIVLKNVPMGMIYETNAHETGVLGIGYYHENLKEPNLNGNLISELKRQKYINKRVYSLYLNEKFTDGNAHSLNSFNNNEDNNEDNNENNNENNSDKYHERGSIIFGGIDHEKYEGKLKTFKIKENELAISIDNIYIKNNDETKSILDDKSNIKALLDSGSTVTMFPKDITQRIIGSIQDIEFDKDIEEFVVRNTENNNTNTVFYSDLISKYENTTIIFEFSGEKFEFSILEFMKRINKKHITTEKTSDANTNSNNRNNKEHRNSTHNRSISEDGLQDIIGILHFGNKYKSKTNQITIGDDLLRLMYVVYDLDDREISMAVARKSFKSNIEVITDKIPRAERALHYSSVHESPSIESNGVVLRAPIFFSFLSKLYAMFRSGLIHYCT